MTSEIATTEASVKTLIDSEAFQKSLQRTFADEGKRKSFRSSVLSLFNSNESLKEVEPMSVLNSALQASTLDLPINSNLGFAYIVPYRKKVGEKQYIQVAQFQMGYKGFIQLAQRSGLFKTINETDVREGEIKSFDRLSGEIEYEWIQDQTERLSKKVVGFASYFKLLNGFEKNLYMTVEEIQAHGQKYSKTYAFGNWKDNFEAMARKTVIKLLLSKFAPLSVETQLQKAIELDQALIGSDGTPEYLDNKPETLEEMQERKENERILQFIKDAKKPEDLKGIPINTDEHRTAYDEKLKSFSEGK